jgi:predicted RNase H-like HicB family nuclease
MGEVVTLDVNLRAFSRKEKKNLWVAVCPRIGVASQGRTESDARKSLQDAVELWFESCLERGVLDQAMRESGFRSLANEEEAPADTEHVFVSRADSHAEDDILGIEFSVHFEIPAYQAAHFLGVPA